MRFPLPLTLKIAGHILSHKIRRVPKFATVLQLEPLHACNLSCAGCGRIREYAGSMKEMMPLEECLAAARECNAPMVSICGGEPLIYPEIEQLVQGLRAQKRIVYICTNALLMRRKMRDYLAAEWRARPTLTQRKLAVLLSEKLITGNEVEALKYAASELPAKPVISPSRWLYWNVHLDGPEKTHDAVVERKGVFNECIQAIRMAKILGYQVATNTTVYHETNMSEVEELLSFLKTLDVDGHTISPGYDFDEAKQAMVKRHGADHEAFFLTRKATIEKFKKIEDWGRQFPILGTPVYLEFLAGKRDLTCSAWAIPTRNVRGWKGPCYLITDDHHASYQEMLEKSNWENLGVVDGEVRDPRCENCMVHCGHEPTASLGLQARPGDTWKNIRFTFNSPRKPHKT